MLTRFSVILMRLSAKAANRDLLSHCLARDHYRTGRDGIGSHAIFHPQKVSKISGDDRVCPLQYGLAQVI